MKQMIVAAAALSICLIGSGAHAGWGTCGGCHNGSLAKSKEQLLAKYTTMDAFIKGAQDSDSPMMSRIKENIEGLKAAASELGLNGDK